MDKSCKLKCIDAISLTSNKAWQCCNTVDQKQSFEVFHLVGSHLTFFLVCRELQEVHNDVKSEADINKHLKTAQVLRKLLEDQHKWRRKQGVNRETVCEKVPNLWQSVFLSNDVPLPDMLLRVVDVFQIHISIIIVIILVECAIQCHCTEFYLDEMVYQSCSSPQLFGSVLLLLRSPLIPRYV